MTVKELAQELNATVPEIFEHYQKIMVNLPEDEDYELNDDLVKRAIPHYAPKIKVDSNIQIEDNIIENEKKVDDKSNLLTSDIEFNKLLDLSNDNIITQIKVYNNIENIVFSGQLKKFSDETNYGFFEDIADINGDYVFYPSYNNQDKQRITKVFIPSIGSLKENSRYYFECQVARKEERIKQQNPFLVSTNLNKVQKTEIITDLNRSINQKEVLVDKLNGKLIDVQKQAESYNELIFENINKIHVQELELEKLNEKINETHEKLIHMQTLIDTLKDRILLCKNLDFISSEDEGKYLNLLTAKEYNPINHLDFVSDFDSSFSELADHIHAYLYHEKNLIYTQYQIRNFLTLLRTNDIIVLSGLSGSGKTQIIKSFAEALGGVVKIIPVKPNWTSSDDLIGYYNPLQMSFLPTPFTEAIVEAMHNPNQLYFICLDEMNLARVEYYFADFLSKLEERNKQPEIELYANHEEELFVSEFSTLLNLVETSIKGKEIKSWQEFLNNEEARTKFFEMLGNSDKESMLQLHAKMKRRLIDILKFPSTIKIPDNVYFIGAINVDETTHYFSPKILDRVHIVKFDNPLLFEEQVNSYFEYKEIEKELLPVYVHPSLFSERKPFPAVNNQELAYITNILKDINKNFLLPLNIDFGIRSIRQSINYADLNRHSYNNGNAFDISLNSIINQKILPRFIFDGDEMTNLGKSKSEIANDLCVFLKDNLKNHIVYDSDGAPIDNEGVEYANNAYNTLTTLINNSIYKGNQFNFFA